jgi:hypothetical protein
MCAAVAIFIFLNTSAKEPIPVWRSCQIGKLQCLLAVLFDQCSELLAIFFSTFCLFLCILWMRNVKPMRQSRRKVQTPGQEPNVASGTRAEQCDRRAPECPEFPSVSSFDLHPSDASIPDFTDDAAEELRIASLQRFHNEIHSARANRSSDDFDGGSVPFLLDPVRKVHLTRSTSLPSPTVTVRVAKMRSFYSLENSIQRPIEYEYFQAPSPEERGMRAAFNLDACVMEGIDKSRFRNRASARTLLSSDVNSSCGKAIEQVIACDRPRAAYNAVLGSRRNLQMAVRKLKAMQEIQFLTASEHVGQS